MKSAVCALCALLEKNYDILDVRTLFSLQATSRACKDTFDRTKVFIRYLCRNGLHIAARWRFWVAITRSPRHFQALANEKGSKQLYLGSLGIPSPDIDAMIRRDVPRTLPVHPLFGDPSGSGQELLFNILKGVAMIHPHVGYCQGQNYVCAILLLTRLQTYCLESKTKFAAHHVEGFFGSAKAHEKRTSHEKTLKQQRDRSAVSSQWIQLAHEFLEHGVDEEVFRLMNALIVDERFDMGKIWSPDVHHLRMRAHQFSVFLRETNSKLHTHFKRIALVSDCFVVQWLLTVFAYSLPISFVLRVWDIYFVEGWTFLFKVGIALLQHFENDLLRLNLEQTGAFFRCLRSNETVRLAGADSHSDGVKSGVLRVLGRLPQLPTPECLLMAAVEVKVDVDRLHRTGMEYEALQLRKRLHESSECGGLSEEAATKLKLDIDSLQQPLREDLLVLREKVEKSHRRLLQSKQAVCEYSAELQVCLLELEEEEERRDALSTQLCVMTGQGATVSMQNVLSSDLMVLRRKLERNSERYKKLVLQKARLESELDQLGLDVEEASVRKQALVKSLNHRIRHTEESETLLLRTAFQENERRIRMEREREMQKRFAAERLRVLEEDEEEEASLEALRLE